jgi:hypothetical protein
MINGDPRQNPFSPSFMTEINRRTDEALNSPQQGDRFEEFYTFWVYVLKVDDDGVLTWQGSGHPSGFPKEAYKGEFVRHESSEAFRKSFTSEGRGTYWVKLCDRDNDVSKFLQDMEVKV